MTVALLEALAADLLEYEDLVSPYIISEYGSLNASALNIRSTYLNITLILYEEDLGELHCSTFCIRKTVAEDFVASFNLELLAGNFYDCVHYKKLISSFRLQADTFRVSLGELDSHHLSDRKNTFFFFCYQKFF